MNWSAGPARSRCAAALMLIGTSLVGGCSSTGSGAAQHSTTPPAGKTPAMQANCAGNVKNLRFAQRGRTNPRNTGYPPYAHIVRVSTRRDPSGVTLSYILGGAITGDNLSLTTWFGTGADDDGMISLDYTSGAWQVGLNPANHRSAPGGESTVRPQTSGSTVTITFPPRVPISDGSQVDLSGFTRTGWGASALATGGRWTDGCPVDGDAAQNPGRWEITMSAPS